MNVVLFWRFVNVDTHNKMNSEETVHEKLIALRRSVSTPYYCVLEGVTYLGTIREHLERMKKNTTPNLGKWFMLEAGKKKAIIIPTEINLILEALDNFKAAGVEIKFLEEWRPGAGDFIRLCAATNRT